MRGDSTNQGELFSYVSLEARIPDNHPIRKVRKIVDTALAEIEPAFNDMYSSVGRPSIPPEQLIRSMLLQIFFTIRSERQMAMPNCIERAQAKNLACATWDIY